MLESAITMVVPASCFTRYLMLAGTASGREGSTQTRSATGPIAGAAAWMYFATCKRQCTGELLRSDPLRHPIDHVATGSQQVLLRLVSPPYRKAPRKDSQTSLGSGRNYSTRTSASLVRVKAAPVIWLRMGTIGPKTYWACTLTRSPVRGWVSA